jgi:hypothetical protein
MSTYQIKSKKEDHMKRLVLFVLMMISAAFCSHPLSPKESEINATDVPSCSENVKISIN